MSIIKKLKSISSLAAILAVMQGGMASADSADNLQAALVNGIYTIRYENVTPPSRSSIPKEKVQLVGGQSILFSDIKNEDFEDPYMMYQVVSGIATSDGINQYSEYTSKHIEETKDNQEETFNYTTCSLNVGEANFRFTRTNKKGEVQYISTKGKNKVAATSAQYNSIGYKITDFGDPAVTALLGVLLPNENKDANAVIFKKVKTGYDRNGLEYADFKAINPGDNVFLQVVRYYFKNGQLVKIYGGQYRKERGEISGIRAIVNVTEFKTTAEQNLLKLPAEINDVTK